METRTSGALPQAHELLSKEPSTAGLSSRADANAIMLNISVYPAQTQNWPWLACAVSVHNYFSPDNLATQCQVMSQITGQSCCSSPMPDACNVPGKPSDALRAMNNLDRVSPASGLSFSDVQTEIYESKPLVLGYSMPGNESAQAIVLCGFDDDGYVYVIDPLTGTARTKLSDLVEFYTRHGGEVSFTQR